MKNDFIDDMTNTGKASYEAIQKLSAINTKALNQLASLQMSLATMGFESGVEQMKLVSSIKDYNEFISAESQFASKIQDKVMNIAQQASEVFAGSQDEVAKWVKDEMPVISEFENAFTQNAKKSTVRTSKPKASKAKAKTKAKAKAK